jgi:hypothetical protein
MALHALKERSVSGSWAMEIRTYLKLRTLIQTVQREDLGYVGDSASNFDFDFDKGEVGTAQRGGHGTTSLT